MKLLEKITLGKETLKNAIAMAPMTRSRANGEGVVSDPDRIILHTACQCRTLLTEAINISEQALGSPLTPGLYSPGAN
jgi:N-ethylmaleimide reductase